MVIILLALKYKQVKLNIGCNVVNNDVTEENWVVVIQSGFIVGKVCEQSINRPLLAEDWHWHRLRPMTCPRIAKVQVHYDAHSAALYPHIDNMLYSV